MFRFGICLLLFGIFLGLFYSMNRYKEIEFKDFRGGEAPSSLVLVNDKYYKAENVKVDPESGKLSIADGIASVIVASTNDAVDNLSQAASSEYLFVCLVNSSFDHLIYRSSDGITWTLVETILEASWPGVQSAYLMTNGHNVFLMGDGVTTNWVSTDDGGTFSSIAYDNILGDGLVMSDGGINFDGYYYAIADGVTSDFSIVRTVNFQTWELVLEYSTEFAEQGVLFEFQGFIHLLAGYNVLYRVIDGRLEQVKDFRSEGTAYFLKISDLLCQVYTYDTHTGEQKLYHWDGTQFLLVNRSPSIVIGAASHAQQGGFSDGENGWYIATENSTKYLVKWDKDGNIFKTSALDNNTSQEKLFGINNTAYHIYIDPSNTYWTCDRLSNYKASGTLETRTVETGELIPKQLILRHAPLETGGSVKLYYKKNRDAAYSSALITSNTVGDIKKKYTFPSGTAAIDFAQLKFELITSDATKRPYDVEAVLLGVPVGLENAK